MIGMRPFPFLFAVAFLLAGCASAHEAHGPEGIPYLCDGGRPLRVFYEGGGWFPRAHARLAFDGRSIEMRATPPTDGLRYASAGEAADGPLLVWTARGEEGWLAELADDSAAERAIAHCARQRAGGDPDPEPNHP